MKLNDIYEEEKPEQPSDFNKIANLLLRQWYWFLFFGVIGLACAYAYNQIRIQQYLVNTSILIPEKESAIDMKNLFAGTPFNQPKNNIYDQIEIVNSYYSINHTLLNLNWRTSVFKKNLLNWKSIYKEEPFDILEPQNFINPKEISIYITPGSNDSYTISVNGQLNRNNVITDLKFEGNGEFGRPFKNQYFNFTLFKKGNNFIKPGEDYSFVFNDLNDATLGYQKRLKAVLKDKKSDIIQCSIEGEDPVKEGEFLNELIKVYIDGKMNLQNEAQLRSLEFINTQLAGISDSLNSAGTRFTDFRSKNNIIDLGAEGTLIMNNLKELESEKAQSQIQLDYFRNLLSYLNSKGDLNKMVSPSVVGIQDASLNSLVLKLGELYNRRQVLSFSAKENNITMMLIDKELTQTRDQLNENLRNLIDNASKTVNSLTERLAGISSKLNKLPQKEQQMINIQRQFTLTSDIYTFLLQKRAETNIAMASKVPDVQIIDVARPETAIPVGLSNPMILIIGFIMGIALPLGFIQLTNALDSRIRTQEDIENHTNLPILGNIIHDHTNSMVTVHENPTSIIAESFRAFRTNLQFMFTEPNGKIISIQSTNPGEGKTFISINLASILAMNNKRVLIIGADMRKSKLHKIFNLSNEHGLSTCLIGQDAFEQVIFPTHIANLFLLPSGPIPPNPSEILGKPQMKMLIDKVRDGFDYVILDNAPTSLVTDGIIVSQLSDLNIFILRYGVSRKQQPGMINHYADKQMINHLAIVVNDIKSNAFGYSFSKYSRYESYYNNSYKKKYYASEDKGLKKRSKKKSESIV